MENENICLKTGFLLRQSRNKKWKARWFVLSEDHLCCYHKRDKNLCTNAVSLEGCSIVCPCLDEDKPDININGAFKVLTPSGEELYYQAAGEEDRDRWAHAIGAVLRSLSTAKQVSQPTLPFKQFKVYANVSEIIGAIQEPEAGVETGGHMRNGVVHKNCCKGSDVIDWLIRWSIVRCREDGKAMAQTLVKLGHLQEVDIHDGSQVSNQRFSDGDKLYRFTSVNLGAKRNSYYDMTDSDSSSSDDNDDEDAEERHDKSRRGRIVKEGFMLKKRNIRKGWKVWKFSVRDNPAVLEYHKSTLCSDSTPVPKLLELQTSTVSDSSKKTTDTGVSKGKKYRIYVKNMKKKHVTIQAKDEQEKWEWHSILQQYCQSEK